jgi:hypothetical protein
MKNIFIIFIIYGSVKCDEIKLSDEARDAKSLKAIVSSSFDHPCKRYKRVKILKMSLLFYIAQNGYQSVVLGSEKHKYGYEIKHQGKHFHFTSTEKASI